MKHTFRFIAGAAAASSLAQAAAQHQRPRHAEARAGLLLLQLVRQEGIRNWRRRQKRDLNVGGCNIYFQLQGHHCKALALLGFDSGEEERGEKAVYMTAAVRVLELL